jgi:hypothetical protein
MEISSVPKRSDVTAARLNLEVGIDPFLVSILKKAKTPRKKTWTLKTDANCLAWFYSHIKIPERKKIDPWDSLDIEDFKVVDVSIPAVETCTSFAQKVASLSKRQTRKLLSENDKSTNSGTPSSSKKKDMEEARKRRRREWEKKMYPKTYVAPLKEIRIANSINILIALRKLVRRRELHIKMMREAVELDWWRAISEDWKGIIRLLTCEIVELVQEWREKLGPVDGDRPWSPTSNQHPRAFLWKGKNYLLKIPTDLDFMCKRSCYGSAQQRNPFLLPFPLEALHEFARADHDQMSWGCRISMAASKLLDEEKRCGSYVWNNSSSKLIKVPEPSLVLLNDIKNSFQTKACNWSNRGVDRRGKSHAGSLVSAHRGSTACTLSTLRSRGSIRSFSSRGGSSGRGNSRGRDIFTPGSVGVGLFSVPQPGQSEEKEDALSSAASTWQIDVDSNSRSGTAPFILATPATLAPLPATMLSPSSTSKQEETGDHEERSLHSRDSYVSDDHNLYPPEYLLLESNGPETSSESLQQIIASRQTQQQQTALVPIISGKSTTPAIGQPHNQTPVMLSSLQLSPFGKKSQRTVTMRAKGNWTPPGYDADNGFTILTQCPLADCLVCDALRSERRIAVYTAKTERSQRVGLYNAMMNSRLSMLHDMSATIIQALWRGALLRQRLIRPMYYEDYEVTSDLGGTRMTTWLPNAHLAGIRLQRVARCALAYWELKRRRRAELERVMAIRIQNRYRINKSKMLMAYLKVERQTFEAKQYKAAVALQNVFRARTARRLVRVMIEARRKSNKDNGAANTILRAWRCAMARHRVFILKATKFQIKISALYRCMKGFDRYQTYQQLQQADEARIKPAHIRLEHLRAALLESERREVKSIVTDIINQVEKDVEADMEAEREAIILAKEKAEAIAYERKTGRKKPVLKRKKKTVVSESKDDNSKENVDHELSIERSVTDVRELIRYMRKRNVLPSPAENKNPSEVLKSWSDFDDRQIVTRLTLDQDLNKGHDFGTLKSILQIKKNIKDVETFLKKWRSLARKSFMWSRVSQRYVQSKGVVPESVHVIEKMHRVAAAVFEHSHLRTYNTQNIHDNLLFVRRHLVERQKQRNLDTDILVTFSKAQALLWLNKGNENAKKILTKKNKEHDRAILDKEEKFICYEDRRGHEMRQYLTSTSYARIALWEVFSTLFDDRSRRELYLHRNKNDKKKIKELDENAVLPPMEEDGAIIVEHVTIALREFQEFTRRARRPVKSTIKNEELMTILDKDGIGRVQFEHVCWWFFSGEHVKRDSGMATHVKNMAQLYLKRKRVLLHRWSTKQFFSLGPVKRYNQKKAKKKAELEYSENRRRQELEHAEKKMKEALEEQRLSKEKALEDEILGQIRFQNDLGDEIWRNMRLDPPYEKHIRPPCWSVELSEAIIDQGIAHKDRKAIPFKDNYIKGIEDTDSENEEEEWEKKAKALVGGEEKDGDEKEDEEKEKEKETEEEEEEEEEEEGGGEELREKVTKKKSEKLGKSKVFSVPFVPRIKVPGNDMRISSMFSRGIAEKQLKEQSEKYRKELRKRRKKREKAEKKAEKEKQKIAAMTPEERLEYLLSKSKKGKQDKVAERAKKKKEKEEKERARKERRKEQKRKKGGRSK